jgi:hypothetical protein
LACVESERFVLSLDADTIPADDRWAEWHISALASSGATVLGTAGPSVAAYSADWWANRPHSTPTAGWDGSVLAYPNGGNRCLRLDALLSLGGFPSYMAEGPALGRIARTAGYQFRWVREAAVTHRNAEGMRNFYRYRRKVGAYGAELDGSISWPGFCRMFLGSARLWARPKEALAAATNAVAIMHGSRGVSVRPLAPHHPGGSGQ